jgi:hypothetical protein
MKNLKNQPSKEGFFGEYGGQFVPAELKVALDEVAIAYEEAKKDKKYIPIPKYPPIVEQYTFINTTQVPAQKILTTGCKVDNLINPHLECFAFNYKKSTYLYRCDERYGNSFFRYESAIELVNEVRNELNYDLTYFYENKLDKELVVKRKLEDKEREIALKLEDIKFNIDKVKGSIKLIGESEILSSALVKLESRERNLNSELQGIKELQYKERIKL